MKISKPKIFIENDLVKAQIEVDYIKGKKNLWYSLDKSYYDLISELSDAYLVALLIPAMSVGEDIYLEGTVSEKLFYNLSSSLQKILQEIIPTLKKITVYPQNVTKTTNSKVRGVATGFSGGIDSFCTLADHYYSDSIIEGYKITHLLFNNVGSGGGRDMKRYKKLLSIAEEIGLPLLRVDSNLNSFYSECSKEISSEKTTNLFQQTHTLRNTSVALLLQKGIGRYLYASSYKYSDIFVGASNSMAYSDMVTLPLLSTDCLDAFSTGSEYSRVEKTLKVAEIYDSYTTLDVCVDNRIFSGYTNCGNCFKCRRTLATLDIAGYLDKYSSAFDLSIYEKHKNGYFAFLLAGKNNDIFSKEIVDFAQSVNYSFPSHSYTIYTLKKLKLYSIVRFFKQIVNNLN